jgi:hypothetical protein
VAHDTGMVEYGALANLNRDRGKAERLFQQAFSKKPREFWHWVNAGGSYLGVKPRNGAVHGAPTCGRLVAW